MTAESGRYAGVVMRVVGSASGSNQVQPPRRRSLATRYTLQLLCFEASTFHLVRPENFSDSLVFSCFYYLIFISFLFETKQS